MITSKSYELSAYGSLVLHLSSLLFTLLYSISHGAGCIQALTFISICHFPYSKTRHLYEDNQYPFAHSHRVVLRLKHKHVLKRAAATCFMMDSTYSKLPPQEISFSGVHFCLHFWKFRCHLFNNPVREILFNTSLVH